MIMIGNNNVKRKYSIEFLGVILDEHISWTDHVRTFENKVAIKYWFFLLRKPVSS